MTFQSKFSTRDASAIAEGTRTPVFVLLERTSGGGRIVRVDGVWLTRQEADEHVERQRHNLRSPLVYAVPANGELVVALRDGSEPQYRQAAPAATSERSLADVVLAYEALIESCANDPKRMASARTAQGEDLDGLWAVMVSKARWEVEARRAGP